MKKRELSNKKWAWFFISIAGGVLGSYIVLVIIPIIPFRSMGGIILASVITASLMTAIVPGKIEEKRIEQLESAEMLD